MQNDPLAVLMCTDYQRAARNERRPVDRTHTV